MTRRDFLTLLGATGAALALPGDILQARTRHPNLLIIHCDQMRWDALSVYGNTDCLTPNIDRLAREGVTVSHAMASCPLCTPSRASFQTGLHPETLGMVGLQANFSRLDTRHRCLAEILRETGYRTGYVGKWHLDGEVTGDPATYDGYVPPGPRRQGWDWFRSGTMHKYWGGHYYEDTPEPIGMQDYAPYEWTELAQEFLSEQRRDPWALMVSYGVPHSPYNPPPEGFEYEESRLFVPPNVPDEQVPSARRKRAGYYGHISAMDSCLRTLLDEKTLGAAADTIVVFTSDHGAMLWDHGVKRAKMDPRDASARVPLILRIPRGPRGEWRQGVVSTEDLAPSLLGLCGVRNDTPMDGMDLSRWLRTGRGRHRDVAYMRCDAKTSFGGHTPELGEDWEAVRNTRYLYAQSMDGEPLFLYDYERDEWGMRNLVGRGRMQRRMQRLLRQEAV